MKENRFPVYRIRSETPKYRRLEKKDNDQADSKETQKKKDSRSSSARAPEPKFDKKEEEKAEKRLYVYWKIRYPHVPIKDYLKSLHSNELKKHDELKEIEKFLAAKEALNKGSPFERSDSRTINFSENENPFKGKEGYDLEKKMRQIRKQKKEEMLSSKQGQLREMAKKPRKGQEFLQKCIDYYFESKFKKKPDPNIQIAKKIIHERKKKERKEKTESMLKEKEELIRLFRENLFTNDDLNEREQTLSKLWGNRASWERRKSGFFHLENFSQTRNDLIFKDKRYYTAEGWQLPDCLKAHGLIKHFANELAKLDNPSQLVNKPNIIKSKINNHYERIAQKNRDFHMS